MAQDDDIVQELIAKIRQELKDVKEREPATTTVAHFCEQNSISEDSARQIIEAARKMAGLALVMVAAAIAGVIFFIAPLPAAIATLFLGCFPVLMIGSQLLKSGKCRQLESKSEAMQEKIKSGYPPAIEQEQNITPDVLAQKKYTELVQAGYEKPVTQTPSGG